MTPVDQDGNNCLAACLATILDLSLDQTRHCNPDGRVDFDAVQNLGLNHPERPRIDWETDPAEIPQWEPWPYLIAVGGSPRRHESEAHIHHCVVVDLAGNLIHDPHPSRAGIRLPPVGWWYFSNVWPRCGV